ncbi:hypothetical protein [Paenibacillus abyssi]|uniref:Uncharacterized protein n=1 Tax=Paenibacillus abyssi TaxID=1340531 RepID=A0A917FY66_9BACL|nr:hypothetical protein [Paenibacillus abyssi]GGG13848.1 hypothetical protein GCM10010916_33460 [Paenibacillus abyssi]
MKSLYLTIDDLISIRYWVSEMLKYRTRSAEKRVKRAVKSLQLPYKLLGSGKSRIVYDLLNGYVLKIPITKDGLQCNQMEYDIYAHCSSKLRKYLCPVMEHGDGWIIMKKMIQRVNLTEDDEDKLLKMKKRFSQEQVLIFSLKAKNLRLYKDRIIIIDYGNFQLKQK